MITLDVSKFESKLQTIADEIVELNAKRAALITDNASAINAEIQTRVVAYAKSIQDEVVQALLGNKFVEIDALIAEKHKQYDDLVELVINSEE